jgi:outer membrane protein assembly factor BamB
MLKQLTRSAAALAAGLVLSAATTAGAADWPQYRGPGHDGVSPEAIRQDWPSGGPKVLWKVPLGESFGSFAVRGDRAFVYASRGDEEGCVALDANTGRELWFTPNGKTIFENMGGKGPRTTPTIDGEFVYVYGTYLKLACLRAADGKVVWQHDVQSEFDGQNGTNGIVQWGNAASPIVDGDLVIVAGGGSGQTFLAFDKKTGKLAWKGGDEKITHASPTPATIGGVRQVVFFMQSGLVSLKSDDGTELWRYKFPFNVSTASSPIVGGDVVYCAAGYGVGGGACKVTKEGDKFSAAELYRVKGNKDGIHWSTPVYHEGNLYGIWGFRALGSAPLECRDMATGEVRWSVPGFGSGGGTVIAGKHLLVQSDTGKLTLVELNPGEFKRVAEAQPLKGKAWTMAVVSNGKIFARTDKEGVCLDVAAAK